MSRIELPHETTRVLDELRGDTPRAAYVGMLIHDIKDGRHGPPASTPDQIIDDAVERATQAHRDGRPGYAEFILTRAAMAVALDQAGGAPFTVTLPAMSR